MQADGCISQDLVLVVHQLVVVDLGQWAIGPVNEDADVTEGNGGTGGEVDLDLVVQDAGITGGIVDHECVEHIGKEVAGRDTGATLLRDPGHHGE